MRRLAILIVAMTALIAGGWSASVRAQDEAARPDIRSRLPPIDFSHAGYRGGGVSLPQGPAVIRVRPGEGDDTDRIMAAIAVVARRPADAEGRRGVVLLDAGEFHIGGQIRIAVDGIVLRGAGSEDDGTTLVATGVDRRALIALGASNHEAVTDPEAVPGVRITGDVAAGADRVVLASVDGLSVGDRVTLHRPSTADWITSLGMDAFVGWRPESRLNWKPGSRDLVWDRRVVAIDGRTVVLDAPITMAMTAAWGGGWLRPGRSATRIRELGVEALRLVSAHDAQRPLDEDHSWFAITVGAAEDVWIRDVTAQGFVGSVVDLGAASLRVTVQDIAASDPVSEIGGLRRRVFYAGGQQALIQRCRSWDGVHDFGVGHAAAGPNVFLDCQSADARGDSGTLGSWASGVLFDGVKVRGGGLNLTHRGRDGQGVGWSAANSVLWNCEATDVQVRSPPGGAANVAIGCRGELTGDGVLEDARVVPGRDFHRAQPQAPASLYRAQLEDRLGAAGLAALEPAVADAVTDAPLLTAEDIDTYLAGLPRPGPDHPLMLVDGEFRIDGRPAWRRRVGFSFFQAQMIPALAEAYGPAITRFAPGLEGQGLTDDLDVLAAGLTTGDVVQHNYGLWYDRRRVDHDFYGSPDQRDGEVWGPFMELPWARSGQGRAWDGLSQYDLTRFNPWFFDRIQRFADLAAQRGVVLNHRMYLQHWLLESRAHYVDFPWRPVNTLQATGLPNEVPAAEAFWDISDPVRRDLHRLYIRHTLEVLKGRSNVVIGLDPEYTGPLSFVRFWLDTIADWEAETSQSVWVSLEAPKAEMDAILDDAKRSAVVDAVGFHHWTYRPDGTLFAVEGGLNKAPRQQVDAIARPQDLPPGADAAQVRRDLWKSTPAMRYRALREYRDRRADLAIVGEEDAFPDLSRAVAAIVSADARAALRPADPLASGPSAWSVGDGRGRHLVYDVAGGALILAHPLPTAARVTWALEASPAVVECLALGEARLDPPAAGPWAAWIEPVAACPAGS